MSEVAADNSTGAGGAGECLSARTRAKPWGGSLPKSAWPPKAAGSPIVGWKQSAYDLQPTGKDGSSDMGLTGEAAAIRRSEAQQREAAAKRFQARRPFRQPPATTKAAASARLIISHHYHRTMPTTPS